jgi:transposase
MNNIKYIGIDVHQATSVFAVIDSQGKLICESILKTEASAIIDLLKGQRGSVQVAFEEGTYAHWLYDVIKPYVAKVIVCDPRKIKMDGNKTDRIDARKIAELLRLNALSAVYHGEQSAQTLKEYARSYISLQQDSTRIMNRVKAIYRGRGIGCRGTALYSPGKRKEWLGKLKDKGAQCRARRLLEQLESFGKLRLEAQKDLMRESRKLKDYKILKGIPGLGQIRIALILAFVMTPHRFRNKRQFWTYIGLSVVRRGSSEYEIVNGELQRKKKKPLPRGLNHNYNRVLKDVFKGAALTASYRGAFKELFDRRVADGAIENIVLLTMARKIAAITLALWKKGERFDIERHQLSEQRI